MIISTDFRGQLLTVYYRDKHGKHVGTQSFEYTGNDSRDGYSGLYMRQYDALAQVVLFDDRGSSLVVWRLGELWETAIETMLGRLVWKYLQNLGFTVDMVEK